MVFEITSCLLHYLNCFPFELSYCFRQTREDCKETNFNHTEEILMTLNSRRGKIRRKRNAREKSSGIISDSRGKKDFFFYTGCKWKIEIAKILKVLQQRKKPFWEVRYWMVTSGAGISELFSKSSGNLCHTFSPNSIVKSQDGRLTLRTAWHLPAGSGQGVQ